MSRPARWSGITSWSITVCGTTTHRPRGMIQVPGNAGGASWSGAAIDPETGMLYVGTQRIPTLVTIRKPGPGQGSYDFIGLPQYLPGPRGLPLLKPPFGSIVAIDM